MSEFKNMLEIAKKQCEGDETKLNERLMDNLIYRQSMLIVESRNLEDLMIKTANYMRDK